MLNKIIEFCGAFWDQVLDVLDWIFSFLFSLLSKLFYAIVDAFFSVIETIVAALDFTQVTALTALQSWTGLPDQVIWLLNYINLPICLAAVLSCYGLRLLLNLLPFIRI